MITDALQVDYLLHRLSGLTEEDIEKLRQKNVAA
jgi:hypothetical protein